VTTEKGRQKNGEKFMSFGGNLARAWAGNGYKSVDKCRQHQNRRNATTAAITINQSVALFAPWKQ